MMEILLSERHREEIREGVARGRSGESAIPGRRGRVSRPARRKRGAATGIIGLLKLLMRRKVTLVEGGEDIV